jgi:soluble lytic murein transglycosylase-like protein
MREVTLDTQGHRSSRRTLRGVAAVLAVPLCIGLLTAAATAREGVSEMASLDDGIAAYRAGEPLRALAVFAPLAEAHPESATPAIWAGVAATAAGKMEEADAYFRAALGRPHSALEERVMRGWLARLSFLREQADAERSTPIAHPNANSIAALARASNPALTAEQAIWMGEHVVAAAQQAGLNPFLLAAVVYIESGFHPSVRSRAGAIGLGQLRPQTARSAGVDPHDPWGNLLGSALTLRAYYVTFRDWSLALAAYNAGAGAVRRYRGIPPYAETRWYVAAVWAVYHRILPD